MKKILLFMFIFSIFSLSSEDKKIISQLSLDDLNSYINGNRDKNSYLLTPWPYEEAPYFLVAPHTDFYLNYPLERENFAINHEEKHILDRLSDLWRGNLGFTFTVSEKILDQLSDEEVYNSCLKFLIETYKEGYFSIINLDFVLNRERGDFSIILNLIDDLTHMGEKLEIVYSLDRYTKPIEAISKRADYIIIKSYDNSGRHSTLENAEEAIETFIKRRDFEPSQLILGIPLYGRKFRSSDPGYWKDMLPYADIITYYQPPADTNESNDYYFNGTQLAAKKEELINRKKLAGAALTPINWDAKGNRSLLNVFRN